MQVSCQEGCWGAGRSKREWCSMARQLGCSLLCSLLHPGAHAAAPNGTTGTPTKQELCQQLLGVLGAKKDWRRAGRIHSRFGAACTSPVKGAHSLSRASSTSDERLPLQPKMK